MILNLWETINTFADNIKDWIVENGQNNPVLWVGLFLLGLAIFGITYRTLSKHK